MQPATSPRGRPPYVSIPRARSVTVGLLLTLLLTVVPGATVAVGSTDDPSPPTVTANEFIPEDRDLSECISALPKPDCGSDARGGWRQAVVLALVLAGTAGIGIRIALAIRRRDASMTEPVGTADDEHDGRVSQP